ncbi:MAG: hypothetical protein WCS85_01820 [Candidatus Peribacteraceae bacterium]|jgi:hypothetical protein
MQKTCRQCSAPYEITKDDLAFYEAMSPTFDGKRFDIPPPTECPDCRRRHRLSFRNERSLHHRKCSATERQIISNYSADKPYAVYDRTHWWSDAYDPLAFGRPFDFGKPFFGQFDALIRTTPVFSLSASPDAEEQNCTYVNYASNNKNCYMMFDSDASEECYYANVMKHNLRCIDCSYVQHSELCYECVDCSRCYRLLYAENCDNCSESAFLENCTGCKHCLLCNNLVQKEYCIKNHPVSKQEFERVFATLRSRSVVEKRRSEFRPFALGFPQKFRHAVDAIDAAGDYLKHVQRCRGSYDIGEAEDIAYSDALYKAKSCSDVSSFGEGIERIYLSGTIGFDVYNVAFCFACRTNCSNMLYCFNCYRSHDCFGCVSLKNHRYCIFNVQYTKDEYERLVAKHIEHMQETGEWGRFFPISLSPFAYNETVAQEYFPLEKSEAQRKGWTWKEAEEEEKQYLGPPVKVPDAIDEVKDDITRAILTCEVSGKPFKIIPQELKFYHEIGIPIPRKCHDQRHRERMALRNPRKLWNRECAKCKKPIETSYAPERPETVYCEECYLASVY